MDDPTMPGTFFQDLTDSENETELSHNLWHALRKLTKRAVKFPYNTDGFLDFQHESGDVRVLAELKFDDDVLCERERYVGPLAQAVCYLHAFQTNGDPTPTVVLLLTRQHCMVVPA